MTDQARAHAQADRFVDTRRLRGVLSHTDIDEADEAIVALLFTERTSGRGALLYRRYDGNLTLVTPRPAQLQ